MTSVTVERGAGDGDQGSELARYARLLWRNKLPVAAAVALSAGAAFLFASHQRVAYEASATVIFQPETSAAFLDLQPQPNVASNPSNSSQALQTQIQLIESPQVSSLVRKSQGFADPVSVSEIGETSTLRVSVRSPSARVAATQANAYANSYITSLGHNIQRDIASTVGKLQGEVNKLQDQIDALDNQIAALGANPNSGQLNALTQRRNLVASQQTSFEGKLTQLQTDSTFNVVGASVLGRASPPTNPVQPRLGLDVSLGALIGLVLGVGGVTSLEALDDRIASREELERVTRPVPTFAVIPKVTDWRKADVARLVSKEAPDAPATEAYRLLRTSLQFARSEGGQRLFQVTSPSGVEGKTTTVANLGVVLAYSGAATLLVDCDLRRPRLHEFFGLDNQAGLTSILLDNVTVDSVLQHPDCLPNLTVLTSGPSVSNPSEWLSSDAMARFISQVRDHFDIVLFDTTPTLPVAEASILAGMVDSTLVIVTAGKTTGRSIRRLIANFDQKAAPIAGFVLNRVGKHDRYGYGYQEYYTYFARTAGRGPKSKNAGQDSADRSGTPAASLRRPTPASLKARRLDSSGAKVVSSAEGGSHQTDGGSHQTDDGSNPTVGSAAAAQAGPPWPIPVTDPTHLPDAADGPPAIRVSWPSSPEKKDAEPTSSKHPRQVSTGGSGRRSADPVLAAALRKLADRFDRTD